ncbi:VOC family protein [Serinicoccus sp. CUA-874]|uniref:VOC family protein n=1 Tax=Serinicoccus sp. CUA-874 TaxID=1517939 RepID=UPI001EDBB5C6|nr:VOC family protein [Serinicoccus sp. CUA-874]
MACGSAMIGLVDGDPALHAYLSYSDAQATLRWLEQVGFSVVARQDGGGGAVLHAEVRWGDVVLMVASADDDYDVPRLLGRSTGGGLYLWLSDPSQVDEWYARALQAGGTQVFAPEETEWGTRRARVLDPEGHEWSIGTYRPGASWEQ